MQFVLLGTAALWVRVCSSATFATGWLAGQLLLLHPLLPLLPTEYNRNLMSKTKRGTLQTSEPAERATPNDMDGSRAAEAVPGTPAQPAGEEPFPPPPPSRPLEEEAPGGASLGDASNAVVPGQDVVARDKAEAEAEVEGEPGAEEEAEEEEAQQEHAFSLSGELVPVTAAAEDDTPNYFDWKELFPELKALVEAMPEISAECGQVAAWKAWPEKHYDEGGGQDWKVHRLHRINKVTSTSSSTT